jgi:hypothetical protein
MHGYVLSASDAGDNITLHPIRFHNDENTIYSPSVNNGNSKRRTISIWLSS